MRQQINLFVPLAGLPTGACVLDLGCGQGTVSYGEYPHLRFIATDQFAHADSRSWPANVKLALADAERLPWANGSFDAALCAFTFEHFRDPRSVLRELDRVIRPGGLLAISIPRATSLEDRLYRFTFKGGGHLQRFSLQSFLEMVYSESGFKLEGLAPAPAGFTWLEDVPWGGTIRRLLYHSFRVWRHATGHNPLASSDYLMRFRLSESLGFQSIRQVCSVCGKPFEETPAGSNGMWKCPICAFENPRVS